MPADAMNGSAFALILFDVGEEIQMERVRRESGARVTDSALKHPTPEYAGVQRPPVVHIMGNTISRPANSFGHASSFTITA